MKEARSGDVVIRYEDCGRGEPALLCLPGWCASRHAFDEFARCFERRVLALDWRGHGHSDSSVGDFGFAELLSAHAGWEAIGLRRELGPERIPRIVLVDWIVTAAPPPFLGALAGLQDPNQWQAVRDKLFGMWLEGVDHPGVKRFVHEDMGEYGFAMWARAGREIAAAYARNRSPLEALGRLDPPPPTLHLYA
jgi:alpha/beta hydrolase fold